MSLDDGRVFADFVSNIVNNKNIIMKSAGTAIRSFCYLADATAGFFTVLLKGKNQTVYNVGNDEAVISILGLAETLVRLHQEKKLAVIRHDSPPKNGYIQSNITKVFPDISRIKNLGWNPTTSIEAGFLRTIRSYG